MIPPRKNEDWVHGNRDLNKKQGLGYKIGISARKMRIIPCKQGFSQEKWGSNKCGDVIRMLVFIGRWREIWVIILGNYISGVGMKHEWHDEVVSHVVSENGRIKFTIRWLGCLGVVRSHRGSGWSPRKCFHDMDRCLAPANRPGEDMTTNPFLGI